MGTGDANSELMSLQVSFNDGLHIDVDDAIGGATAFDPGHCLSLLTEAERDTGWRRWLLRVPETIQRDFELDSLGVEVMDMCDGQKTVRYIVERFAKRNGLNEHEARQAVTTFLRTLIRKGLVQMMVDASTAG